ncbi:TPA: transposase [Clostridioides difficile]|uniref:helix-turn-helix domain-containing protein n=1 Tax=Clostridioides difficile TaxID=1496 RepID=UPI00038DB2EF|nr:helix-turn-helix domain-containing protein [Clostridioides difficile]EGT5448702.1 transposase [Clostridioides difficile]EII6834820.1 helix-turn-helix domain-containing protein [Clostridioides difficile]EIJ0742332.1 helix-turn-helix domain-containing protein [Clostridioides difficile]EQI02677.1 transposase family protein [Clostridioides difficile F314]MBF4709845.1 helix-turn-helix domain-containing protein [Clostridioides difficile]
MSKTKVSSDQKIKAIESYLKGENSVIKIMQELNIGKRTFRECMRNYETFGNDGLIKQSHKSCYSKESKLNAIEDYLNGKGSYDTIAKKYKMRSVNPLKSWVKEYNLHKEIKQTPKGGIFMETRKTTLNERVEIVKDCIEHDFNYNLIAKKYFVSYSQVRRWTLKYKESGIDGLEDRRGKAKKEDELTQLDEIKLELKIVKAEKHRLKLENEFLKKLKNIERGW